MTMQEVGILAEPEDLKADPEQVTRLRRLLGVTAQLSADTAAALIAEAEAIDPALSDSEKIDQTRGVFVRGCERAVVAAKALDVAAAALMGAGLKSESQVCTDAASAARGEK